MFALYSAVLMWSAVYLGKMKHNVISRSLAFSDARLGLPLADLLLAIHIGLLLLPYLISVVLHLTPHALELQLRVLPFRDRLQLRVDRCWLVVRILDRLPANGQLCR